MPQLTRPQFPDRTLSIKKTGAKPGKMATAAIQKAIDRLAQKGGGTVIIPAGQWLSGRIILKSNIELRLEKDAVLEFSDKIEDYLPVVLTRNEGVDINSLGALIYAYEAENIAVTGEGKLVGPLYESPLGDARHAGISDDVEKIPLAERIYDGNQPGDNKVFLPVFFGPVSCKNILVEGVKFERSIFWNIAPTYCQNIIIRNVEVASFGHGRTDGIDLDSSSNALIEYVTLDCGDDCFTLKAGRGNDGVDRGIPTENVVIRHCKVKRGVGGVTIGTETAGGIRNVYMTDVVMEQPTYPFYFKTRRPRGGGGENVWIENVTVKNSKRAAFFFDMLGSATYVGELANRYPARPIGKLTPRFANFNFKNITIENCPQFITAKGLPEQPIENLTFENVKSGCMLMKLQDVNFFEFK